MQYIQYDEDGHITATVTSFGPAPEHPRQLVFEVPVETAGKCVEIETGTLIDSVVEEDSSEEPPQEEPNG